MKMRIFIKWRFYGLLHKSTGFRIKKRNNSKVAVIKDRNQSSIGIR